MGRSGYTTGTLSGGIYWRREKREGGREKREGGREKREGGREKREGGRERGGRVLLIYI